MAGQFRQPRCRIYIFRKETLSDYKEWQDWLLENGFKIEGMVTNNSLEGTFTDLKTKLRNHNGLSKTHRMVFIDEYFKASFL